MRVEESRIVPEKSFGIIGMSYIGVLHSNTAMFITRKVKHLLDALKSVLECLVFAEEELSPRATIL